MTKADRAAKAVAGHAWSRPEDWAEALGHLADLTDDQIERLARSATETPQRNAPRAGVRGVSPGGTGDDTKEARSRRTRRAAKGR